MAAHWRSASAPLVSKTSSGRMKLFRDLDILCPSSPRAMPLMRMESQGLTPSRDFVLKYGIEGPGANDVMALRSKLGRHAKVLPIRPAGHGKSRDGAVHPGVQDILLWNEIITAALAFYRRAGLVGIQRKPFFIGHQDLAGNHGNTRRVWVWQISSAGRCTNPIPWSRPSYRAGPSYGEVPTRSPLRSS